MEIYGYNDGYNGGCNAGYNDGYNVGGVRADAYWR